MNDFNRLRCPHCRRYYKNKDQVVLDEINTVIHMRCYSASDFGIKDRGTYRALIERYDYFEDLRVFKL